MKRRILLFAAAVMLATGCYDDYVRDFDYSAVFVAYQYDLRTFVLDEGEKFDFTVALGGVMTNEEDRNVELVLDPTLLENGLDGLKDNSLVSGEYVTEAIKSSGITELTLLPENYYTIEGLEGLAIRKGKHTASVTLRATEAMRADSKVFAPCYALGFRVVNAEADTVLQDRNFAVVAVKCENRFYGNWSHSCLKTVYDAAGNKVSSDYTSNSIADDNVYILTTIDGNSVVSDKVAGVTGAMTLTFDGDDITVSSEDGKVAGTGKFNGNRLLQARELYLNYTVTEADNSRTEVSDTLYFRNRMRDGVNEWQDENPENYK